MGRFSLCFHFYGVEEALFSFSGFGAEAVFWQRGNDVRGDLDAVFHMAFGHAWVGTYAGDADAGTVGAEGFVLQLAELFSVDGVAEVGAEFFHVHGVDAPADLFIWRKQDA